MANEQNLKPFSSDQSREEAKKNGAKGGKASGEARRKKKSLKQAIETVMQLTVDEGTKAVLEQMGIDADEQNVQTAIVFGMAMKAMRGDVKAADYLAKYAGNDPHNEIEKERLKIEKKRLTLQEKAMSVPQPEIGEDGEMEDVVIYLPDNGRNDNE